ncbi:MULTISPECIES: hypothetical protein [unclassified Streptomyces]|nr:MULTISPECIES: hypothetical protein [unclassified Streptomyces]
MKARVYVPGAVPCGRLKYSVSGPEKVVVTPPNWIGAAEPVLSTR